MFNLYNKENIEFVYSIITLSCVVYFCSQFGYLVTSLVTGLQYIIYHIWSFFSLKECHKECAKNDEFVWGKKQDFCKIKSLNWYARQHQMTRPNITFLWPLIINGKYITNTERFYINSGGFVKSK